MEGSLEANLLDSFGDWSPRTGIQQGGGSGKCGLKKLVSGARSIGPAGVAVYGMGSAD
jgi:hypothetical protein